MIIFVSLVARFILKELGDFRFSLTGVLTSLHSCGGTCIHTSPLTIIYTKYTLPTPTLNLNKNNKTYNTNFQQNFILTTIKTQTFTLNSTTTKITFLLNKTNFKISNFKIIIYFFFINIIYFIYFYLIIFDFIYYLYFEQLYTIYHYLQLY